MAHAASLGYVVSVHLSQKNGWVWPNSLAKKVLVMLE
jgi:hypothetical protein